VNAVLLAHLITDPYVLHFRLSGLPATTRFRSFQPAHADAGGFRKAGARVRTSCLRFPPRLDGPWPTSLAIRGLHSEAGLRLPLTQLVHEKTGGKPLLRDPVFLMRWPEGAVRIRSGRAAGSWDLAVATTKNPRPATPTTSCDLWWGIEAALPIVHRKH